LGELTRERMHVCSDELAHKFLKSVRAIYGSTERGTPIHLRSCVAMEIDGERYLVSAAHVIDNNDYTSLYVSGEKDLILIESQVHITTPPEGDREADKLDFAILPLSKNLQDNLGEIFYLKEEDLLFGDLKRNDKCCLALGYPNSKNKINPKRGNNLKETAFVYTSNLKFEKELFVATGTDEKHHYLLDYCPKHSKDEHGNTVNSVQPKGVSGGGLFLIEDMTTPDTYWTEKPCSGKLIGILIELNRENKVLIYTKLSTVINALKSKAGRR
jgi:hypothetical protein